MPPDPCWMLDQLAAGAPLGHPGSHILRNRAYLSSISEITRFLSLHSGASRARESLWLIGARGMGKSECLANIQQELSSRASLWNNEKAAIAELNLSYIHSTEDFHSQLFSSMQRAGLLTSQQVIEQVRKPPDERMESVTGMGIDIVFSLLKVALPPLASWAIGKVLKNLARITAFGFKATAFYIRTALRRRGITSNAEVEILTSWIRYSLNPCRSTWRDFEFYKGREAKSGELASIVCNLLQKSGYTTLVLLVDEADELADGSSREELLKLWNRPASSDHYDFETNQVFVLAGTEAALEMRVKSDRMVGDDGFSSRFFGGPAAPFPVIYLDKPEVSAENNAKDDFASAVTVVSDLVRLCMRSNPSAITPMAELTAREMLTNGGRQEPKWRELWQAVTRLLIP